jgi:hypothetical protein
LRKPQATFALPTPQAAPRAEVSEQFVLSSFVPLLPLQRHRARQTVLTRAGRLARRLPWPLKGGSTFFKNGSAKTCSRDSINSRQVHASPRLSHFVRAGRSLKGRPSFATTLLSSRRSRRLRHAQRMAPTLGLESGRTVVYAEAQSSADVYCSPPPQRCERKRQPPLA